MRVLTYHRVANAGEDPYLDPSLISATPEDFERQMGFLARNYEVVSMDDVLDALEGRRRLSSRAALITFDDGYRDFAENAWPILKIYGLPVVLFVPTAYPDHPERAFWWDRLYQAVTFTPHPERRDALLGVRPGCAAPERLSRLSELRNILKAMPHAEAMALVEEIAQQLEVQPPRRHRVLTWKELRSLSKQGVTIGAHTRTHPILSQITADELREEIRGSQDDLQREIGDTRPIFCYPSGDHDDRVVRILREEGFAAAFTTLDGQNDLRFQDPLCLRRTNITRRTTFPIFRLRLWRWVSRIDAVRHRRKTHFTTSSSPNGGIVMRLDSSRATQLPSPERSPHPPVSSPLRVAYIMSRFPKLTETFVLYEILQLKALGVQVEIYPLLRKRQPVAHRAAEELVRQANFRPFLSLPILYAHVHFIRRQPLNYFKTLLEVLWATLRSPRYFAGAVVYFPKSVRFAYEMAQKRVDHVHAHFANHPSMVAFVIHRLTGIPFSFTAHGSDLQVDQVMLDRKVEAAKHVVTVSQFNKELIVRVCGERQRHKVRVIHCGVDPTVFVPSLNSDQGPLQIVCVGSFEEVKGHRYLIEACRLLKTRGIDFRCHFVGDGHLRQELKQQIARAGLADQVILHGALRRRAVAKLVAEADVMALASVPTRDGRREGIPVALMEAMASGLPVVSTNIGGIPELVETGLTGFLVPPRKSSALADALQRLAEDPELRRQMGSAGREKVLREFNLRRNTEALMSLFQDEVQTACVQEVLTPAERPESVVSG